MLEACGQSFKVALEHVTEAGKVNSDNADRTGLFSRTEQAIAALEQFAKIKLQAAAHRPDHFWLKIRVDEVLEIRQAVFGGHFEKRLAIGVIPVKVFGDVVGRNREGESTALIVAHAHHVDKCAVDQIHFGLQFAIGKISVLAADKRMLGSEVFRAVPVKGQVGERSLCTPARGNVEIVNEFLNTLEYFVVAYAIEPYKRSQIGIERRERLCTSPFILQGAKKVYHLTECT